MESGLDLLRNGNLIHGLAFIESRIAMMLSPALLIESFEISINLMSFP